MHQIFMIVVILALLPYAIATAIALGQILFFLLLAALAVLALIYLIANPDVLFGILGAAGIFVAFIAGGIGVMHAAARAEKRWPCILQRAGYGSGALLGAFMAVALPLDGASRGTPPGEMLIGFLFFGGISGVLGWWATKAKPTDTSKWFKA